MRSVRLFSANVGLAALVLLDVPLIIGAIHHGRGGGTDLSSAAAAVSVQTSAARPTPETAAVTERSARRPVMLSISGPSNGWRVRPGCGRAPHLAATTDGGRSWHRLAAPAPHVLRIVQTGAGAGWLVGADSACTPAFYSTSDEGVTWAAGSSLGEAWVVIGRQLRLPNGTTTTPCATHGAMQGVAPSSVDVAMLTCESAVLTTADGGGSWAPVARFPHGGSAVAAALAPGGSGQGVALLSGSRGCAGLAVLTTDDAGGRWQANGCLDALQPPAAVSLATDGSGYLLATGGTATSSDGGKTWSLSTRIS